MLYWMSFADDTGFLGACISEGRDLGSALYQAHQHDCNPGGEVASLELPDVNPNDLGPYVMWKLYSRDEIDEIDEAIPWGEVFDE